MSLAHAAWHSLLVKELLFKKKKEKCVGNKLLMCRSSILALMNGFSRIRYDDVE